MKPKLLLHVCCGPCSVAIFEELLKEFDLVVHFYNPNIHPLEEYEKRKTEVKKLCQELNLELIEDEYNSNDWFEFIKGLEKEAEGGERCKKCLEFRLDRAGKIAKEKDCIFFTTSLSSGRNKQAEIINPIGNEIAERYGIKFLEADWKKGGRQEKANKLCKLKNIYRQDYCGCIFSKRS
ncbi:MAG: epoxyqueuosine reductase QueH [Patescibacteria group bacterium]